MGLIAEMWDDGWVGRCLLALLVLLLALIPIAILGSIEEAKQWQAFAAEHDCKVVGHISGSTNVGTGFGMMSNGQMGTAITTTSTPSKTGFLCNDGVTYWR